MYADWRSRRRSKAEGPGDGVGSTLTVVEAVIAVLDTAIDRSKLSRPVGRPGGRTTREGARGALQVRGYVAGETGAMEKARKVEELLGAWKGGGGILIGWSRC